MTDRELAKELVRALPGGGRDRRGGPTVTVDGIALPIAIDQRDGGLRVRLPTATTDGATLRLRARARTESSAADGKAVERVASKLGGADVLRDGSDPALLAAWIDPPITEALPQLLWVHQATLTTHRLDGPYR